MLGASVFKPVEGAAGGVLRCPVVVGGALESRAVRLASRLPLNAKISTKATRAIPAIHPQVAPDQEPDSAGISGSRYSGRTGSR